MVSSRATAIRKTRCAASSASAGESPERRNTRQTKGWCSRTNASARRGSFATGGRANPDGIGETGVSSDTLEESPAGLSAITEIDLGARAPSKSHPDARGGGAIVGRHAVQRVAPGHVETFAPEWNAEQHFQLDGQCPEPSDHATAGAARDPGRRPAFASDDGGRI